LDVCHWLWFPDESLASSVFGDRLLIIGEAERLGTEKFDNKKEEKHKRFDKGARGKDIEPPVH
jgi:hypothetical protein